MAQQKKLRPLRAGLDFIDLNVFFKDHDELPPLDSHFDFREVDDGFEKRFSDHHPMLHPKFYGISISAENGLIIRLGIHGTGLEKPPMIINMPQDPIKKLSGNDHKKTYYLFFTAYFLRQQIQLAALIKRLPFFQTSEYPTEIINSFESEMLDNLCHFLINAYVKKDRNNGALLAASAFILTALIQIIYEGLSKQKKAPAIAPGYTRSSLMEEFRSGLKNNIGSKDMPDGARSVNFYAEKLAVHPNHLNATVKERTGQNVLAFIHAQVMEEAKSFLVGTGMSVKEIAFRLAFKEPSHFNAFFRKHSGVSPATYRLRACA